MDPLIADNFEAARLLLSLRRAGVTDNLVLSAMEEISRAAFVAPQFRHLGMEDCVLPIPCGQYVFHPIVTGQLLQALQIRPMSKPKTLIIGAGSLYSSALLAKIGAQIFAVERYRTLVSAAQRRIATYNLDTINIRLGNGLSGWPECGPFDRILLCGQVEHISRELRAQLAPGGILVAPIDMDGLPRIICQSSEGASKDFPLFEHVHPLEDYEASAL